MRLQPSASYSFTMRLRLPQQGNAFAAVAQAIAESAGMLGAIDLVRVERDAVIRDLTVACGDSGHAEAVARVADGTAVLGLGDIGPAAAMPVMEGKAMLFKEFAGIDAIPLCIDTTDT